MTDKSKYTLTFLAGAAVGAGLGILFAPKPGKETREDVKKKLGEIGQKGKELLAEGKEVIQQQKVQLSAAIDAGKDAYNEAGKEFNRPVAQTNGIKVRELHREKVGV
jgi:gas vesicle protein